jgi:hypothetical protein
MDGIRQRCEEMLFDPFLQQEGRGKGSVTIPESAPIRKISSDVLSHLPKRSTLKYKGEKYTKDISDDHYTQVWATEFPGTGWHEGGGLIRGHIPPIPEIELPPTIDPFRLTYYSYGIIRGWAPGS